jgi:hypothetical protein
MFDQDLLIDKRFSMLSLKERISEVIHLPIDEFKLCRNLAKHEYKQLDQSIEDSGFFDYSAVFVEKGTPLRPNQYHIKIFTYDINKLEPWGELSTEVLSDDMSILDVKKLLESKLNIPASRMRIRDRTTTNKPGKTFLDTSLLKECIPKLYDGKDIVVQQLENENALATVQDSELIIEVQKWKPSTWYYSVYVFSNFS